MSYTGVIEIKSIKGNSGSGNSLFSKVGRMDNCQHKVFSPRRDKSLGKALVNKKKTPTSDLGKLKNFMEEISKK